MWWWGGGWCVCPPPRRMDRSGPGGGSPSSPGSSPHSLYLDAVSSPRFWSETQSPVPLSPLPANTAESPRPASHKHSPKCDIRDKENRFTFDPGPSTTTTAPVAPRTPVDKDVVDCCRRVEHIAIDSEQIDSALLHNSIQVRRQQLKSKSLDSNNAKILKQKLCEEAFLMKESGVCESEPRPRRLRNHKNLTIDVTQTEPPLELSPDPPMEATSDSETPSESTPRTPTLRHKAISLDSSDAVTLTLPRQDLLYVPPNSVSVPNTPKRQLKRLITPRGKDPNESRCHCMKDSGVFLREQHASLMVYQPPRTRRLPEQLSLSAANLKTLPEGEPCEESPPRSNPRTSLSNHSLGEPMPCLLLRRGSHHSLTLDLSVAPPNHSSDCYLTTAKQGLLERRTSNMSLSLDVGATQWTDRSLSVSDYDLNGSSGSLSRSVDHTRDHKKGILERRSSNTSLTLRIPGAEGRGRKCVSSDDLSAVSTEPLSPRTTAAHFRAHLVALQHLHSASHLLNASTLRDLHTLFTNGYSSYVCDTPLDAHQSRCTNSMPEKTQCAHYQKWLLRTMHQEFWDMPTNFQEKSLVSGSHSKNRYRTILPNEHSRVRLSDDWGLVGDSLYINANYIKGPEFYAERYIATQGPLPNTVYDFWCMVCQAAGDSGEAQVVMLTEVAETERPKCHLYFGPAQGDVHSIPGPDKQPSLTVHTETVTPTSSHTVRRLVVSRGDGPRYHVTHRWFHHWPDHACPEDVTALLRVALDVLDAMDAVDPSPPPVVHCSAGIGRTGCFLALLNGIIQLRSDAVVDVLAIVCNMRLDRGGMVQTSEQYELIHRLLAAYQHNYLDQPNITDSLYT